MNLLFWFPALWLNPPTPVEYDHPFLFRRVPGNRSQGWTPGWTYFSLDRRCLEWWNKEDTNSLPRWQGDVPRIPRAKPGDRATRGACLFCSFCGGQPQSVMVSWTRGAPTFMTFSVVMISFHFSTKELLPRTTLCAEQGCNIADLLSWVPKSHALFFFQKRHRQSKTLN